MADQETVITTSPEAEPQGAELLPKWSDCEAACDNKTATPLQRFIYEYEPSDDAEIWRERLAAAVTRADLPRATADADDDIPRGFWPTLVDRGDGVKGHYCIGRLIRLGESYWEFWNHGKWLSAGQVFIGKEVALVTLANIRTAPRATGETTVEAALAELREIFPDWPSKIEITTDDISRVWFWPSKLATVESVKTGRSLADCMAQVRAATRTEGEGEK